MSLEALVRRTPVRPKWRWVVVCSAWSLSFTTINAAAQSGAATPDAGALISQTARETIAAAEFQKGVSLFNDRNDPEGALKAFQESFRLFPTFIAGLDIAACQKALQQYAPALDQYDDLLTAFGGGLTPAERNNVESQRLPLLDRVGELDLRVSEPGASIVVDGVERGKSPSLAYLRLDTGAHTVRLTRDGFQTNEQQVSIAPGRHRTLEVKLVPLVGVGMLSVTESGDKTLDVLVDGAVVGQTPWRGNVSVGLHSVRLSGAGQGTSPTSVDIRLKHGSELILRAVPLDTDVSVEPQPVGSTVYVDGIFVGNGTWAGALPAGQHRFEVISPGYVAFKSELMLVTGKRQRIHAKLELDTSHQQQVLLGLYVEANVGLLFARSLRGSTDQACDCDGRSRPFGFLAGARIGYSLHPHLALELGGGYLHISESSQRQVNLLSDPGSYGFQVGDLHDQVSLSGPFATLGLGARFFSRSPLTARLTSGLAILTADAETAGIATGMLRGPGGTPAQIASGHLAIDEPARRALTPFVSTELRLGYFFSRRLSADIGVALMLMIPANIDRSGRNGLATGAQTHDIGVLTLPNEILVRPFLTFLPSLGGRFDL